MIFTRRNAGYIIAIVLMAAWIAWLLGRMGEQAGGTLTRILVGIGVMVLASGVAAWYFIGRHRTKCPECDQEVGKGQERCPNCGHSLTDETSPA